MTHDAGHRPAGSKNEISYYMNLSNKKDEAYLLVTSSKDLDRILRGYVVDFVDIGFWPIFNIADLSIVLGVMVLAYHLWDEDSDVPTLETSDNKLLS